MEKIHWQTFLDLTPEQIGDLRLVGYHYIRQGKFDIARSFFEALAILQSQKSLQDQDPYDFQVLGGLYLQLRDTDRALRYFDRALRLDGDHPQTQINRVKSLFILKRFDEAMQAAEQLRDCQAEPIRDMAKALQMAHQELYEEWKLAKNQ